MSKFGVFMKASFLHMRVYLRILLGVTACSILSSVIVELSVGGQGNNSEVSVANMLLIFLIMMAIVLPVSFFRRIVNLGASRGEYYRNLLYIYMVWAAILSVVNVLWLKLEVGVIRDYVQTLNILEVFHWNQFGIAGTLLYQFGAYMVLISLFNLLFSGLRHVVGWIIWVILIAAIPIGTSIPLFRPHVADGFTALLFNDSLLQGFALTAALSCLFLAGGWLFTRSRPF